MVQVPAATKVTVVLATVHILAVAVVNATVKELLEDAEIEYEPLPNVLLLSEPKVMV
jgi:hypothetical protein